MNFLLAAIVGYLIGSISPADIIARIRGVDYRSVGSGNPGATNIGRALGRKTGVLVAVLDILKGFLPTLLFAIATGDIAVAEVAGFAAVLGHVTSPFLKGHGGKGVATAAGAVLAIEPIWIFPVLVVFLVAFKVSHRMGIASVLGVLTLIPAAVVWNSDSSEIVFACALAALIVFRHQSNIRAAWQARQG